MNPDPAPNPSILTREDGATIAYHRMAGRAPGVVFLGGFMSDMNGTKAAALDAFCRARGQAFVRFDYFGHGQSSGEFSEATVGRWKDDALCVLDNLTAGAQVLVGSELRAPIQRDGQARIPSAYGEEGYLITRKFLEDGRQHLIMGKPIPVSCPVRLIHGMRDEDVPYRASIDLAANLQSEDVRVELVKDGNHRLARDQDLALLARTLESLLG